MNIIEKNIFTSKKNDKYNSQNYIFLWVFKNFICFFYDTK